MKRAGLFLLAFSVLLSGIAFGAKAKYRVFRPSGAAESVFLKSGEQQFKYFAVKKGSSFGFEAVGPTKIKIRTRAELLPGVKEGDYEIQVWEGDKLVTGRKAKTRASALSLNSQIEKIGIARTVIIKVPKGKHSYRLWITSDKYNTFYARFYQEKRKIKKAEYSTYTPSDYKKQVTLATGKHDISYYLVDNNGGVTLTVVGPTKLRIYCRANFSQDIKGNAKFSLGLFEKNVEAAKFAGVAKLAQDLNFKEIGDIVPSRLHTFIFDVPEGRHQYEVRKINSASPNLAVRFKIRKVGLGMVQ
ncbi:MAG: hypothetical protein A2W25_15845 [candidate division Zixibacteria bacterium RBG_16_53_22]|nr:MAG: hypothetical protein A2W25_15845 [candidate division Zixibacteria bacterium RBG_16_53_22]